MKLVVAIIVGLHISYWLILTLIGIGIPLRGLGERACEKADGQILYVYPLRTLCIKRGTLVQ